MLFGFTVIALKIYPCAIGNSFAYLRSCYGVCAEKSAAQLQQYKTCIAEFIKSVIVETQRKVKENSKSMKLVEGNRERNEPLGPLSGIFNWIEITERKAVKVTMNPRKCFKNQQREGITTFEYCKIFFILDPILLPHNKSPRKQNCLLVSLVWNRFRKVPFDSLSCSILQAFPLSLRGFVLSFQHLSLQIRKNNNATNDQTQKKL